MPAPVYTKKVLTQVTIDEYGNVLVRRRTVVFEDGKQIGESFDRTAYSDTSDISKEEDRIKALVLAARKFTWEPKGAAK